MLDMPEGRVALVHRESPKGFSSVVLFIRGGGGGVETCGAAAVVQYIFAYALYHVTTQTHL